MLFIFIVLLSQFLHAQVSEVLPSTPVTPPMSGPSICGVWSRQDQSATISATVNDEGSSYKKVLHYRVLNAESPLVKDLKNEYQYCFQGKTANDEAMGVLQSDFQTIEIIKVSPKKRIRHHHRPRPKKKP